MDDPVTAREYRERVVNVAKHVRRLDDDARKRFLRLLKNGDPKLSAQVLAELENQERLGGGS